MKSPRFAAWVLVSGALAGCIRITDGDRAWRAAHCAGTLRPDEDGDGHGGTGTVPACGAVTEIDLDPDDCDDDNEHITDRRGPLCPGDLGPDYDGRDGHLFATWGRTPAVPAVVADSACRAWGGAPLGVSALVDRSRPVSQLPAAAYEAGKAGLGWWTDVRWTGTGWAIGGLRAEGVEGPWCGSAPTPADALPGFDGDMERWGAAVGALRLVLRSTAPAGCFALPAVTELGWVACERDY